MDGNRFTELIGISLQSKAPNNGKIIYAYTGDGTSVYVARLMPDGITLDSTFNSGGTPGYTTITLVGGTGRNLLGTAEVQPIFTGSTLIDEKIVISAGVENNFVVGRLNSDGTVDTTFGDPLTPGFRYVLMPNFAVPSALLILGDGSILQGGSISFNGRY